MSLTATEVWTRLLDRARTELSDHIVDTWLVPLTAAEYSGEALTLNAPDQFSVEWNERATFGNPRVAWPRWRWGTR
jgi:chromosomal replication initiation ATPase DnaA